MSGCIEDSETIAPGFPYPFPGRMTHGRPYTPADMYGWQILHGDARYLIQQSLPSRLANGCHPFSILHRSFHFFGSFLQVIQEIPRNAANTQHSPQKVETLVPWTTVPSPRGVWRRT